MTSVSSDVQTCFTVRHTLSRKDRPATLHPSHREGDWLQRGCVTSVLTAWATPHCQASGPMDTVNLERAPPIFLKGPHPVVLSDHSWCYVQQLFPEMLTLLSVMGVKHRPSICDDIVCAVTPGPSYSHCFSLCALIRYIIHSLSEPQHVG